MYWHVIKLHVIKITFTAFMIFIIDVKATGSDFPWLCGVCRHPFGWLSEEDERSWFHVGAWCSSCSKNNCVLLVWFHITPWLSWVTAVSSRGEPARTWGWNSSSVHPSALRAEDHCVTRPYSSWFRTPGHRLRTRSQIRCSPALMWHL